MQVGDRTHLSDHAIVAGSDQRERAVFRKVGRFLGIMWFFQLTDDDQELLMTPVPLGPYFAIGTLLVLSGLVPTGM